MHLLTKESQMHLILFAFPYPALYLLVREIQPVVQLLIRIHVQQVCCQLSPVYRNEVACTNEEMFSSLIVNSV